MPAAGPRGHGVRGRLARRPRTFNIVCCGDSNTGGPTPPVAWSMWPSRVVLGARASLPHDTIGGVNNGVGSTASYDLYANRATQINDESPSVVVIVHGTNDAYYDDPANGYPRGDGQDYGAASWRTRMDTITTEALALTDASGRGARVVICSPPPAHPQSYPGSLSWRDNTRLSAIRDQAEDLVADRADYRVQFVDLLTGMSVSGWETAYIDTADGGVHLNDAGCAAAARLILPAVVRALAWP